MRRLFFAGLIGGFAQIIAVTAATIFVVAEIGHGRLVPMTVVVADPQYAAHFLTWVDLLLALGVALTRTRFVDETGLRIREAAYVSFPAAPDRACKALLVQLWITSAGLGALSLRPPPATLMGLAETWSCSAEAMLLWPGLMSVGVAAFGANAHAAARTI